MLIEDLIFCNGKVSPIVPVQPNIISLVYSLGYLHLTSVFLTKLATSAISFNELKPLCQLNSLHCEH